MMSTFAYGTFTIILLFASRLRPAVHPVRDLDWCRRGWSSQGEVLVYMHFPFEVINAIAVQYSSNQLGFIGLLVFIGLLWDGVPMEDVQNL